MCRHPNGSETLESFNNNTEGIITYTTRGYVSVIMTSGNSTLRPPHLLWPPRANDSDTDWALIGRSIMSYTTQFHINKDLPASQIHGQVLHGPIDIANVPSLVGTMLVRNYTVEHRDGNEYLLLQTPRENATSRSDISWRRIA